MRVAIIPARGGSVRIPRKNIREFHGAPMLIYPMAAAAQSGLFDLVIVSTDNDVIATFAFSCGAVVVPREADDGSTGTQEIAARVLDALDLRGSACVIYPCTPLLTPQLLKLGHDALLQPHAKPFARSVGPDGQDAGCFYWGWSRAFRSRTPLDAINTVDVPLPAEHVCDINTIRDFERAEKMFDVLNGGGNG